MIQYESTIQIAIDYPTTQILDALRKLYTISYLDNHITLELKSVGSPDQEFSTIAKIIWQANSGYCKIEFFVSKSELSYSSPSVYDLDRFEAIL